MDPFRSIEGECGGDISESQEQKLRATAFIGDDDYDHNNDPNNSPATSAAVDGEDDSGPPSFFISASPSDAPPPMRPADAVVQICTPPASPSVVDLAPLSLDDAAAVETEKTKGKSRLAAETECSKDKSNENSLLAVAVKEEPKEIDPCSPPPSAAVSRRYSQPSSAGNKSGKKKLGARRRKSIGAKIAADNASPAASTKSPPLPKSADASRKFPTSFSGQQSSSPSSAGAVANNLHRFPANILEVVKALSEKPNRRFADTDILEIAKMKGIEFSNPPWWRPGGYSDDDDD